MIKPKFKLAIYKIANCGNFYEILLIINLDSKLQTPGTVSLLNCSMASQVHICADILNVLNFFSDKRKPSHPSISK